jgi:hypothetical protein
VALKEAVQKAQAAKAAKKKAKKAAKKKVKQEARRAERAKALEAKRSEKKDSPTFGKRTRAVREPPEKESVPVKQPATDKQPVVAALQKSPQQSDSKQEARFPARPRRRRGRSQDKAARRRMSSPHQLPRSRPGSRPASRKASKVASTALECSHSLVLDLLADEPWHTDLPAFPRALELTAEPEGASVLDVGRLRTALTAVASSSSLVQSLTLRGNLPTTRDPVMEAIADLVTANAPNLTR